MQVQVVAVKERGLLMRPALVTATTRGLKTVTTRPMRQQPNVVEGDHALVRLAPRRFKVLECPYGVAGDMLYVRERWRVGTETGRGGAVEFVYSDGTRTHADELTAEHLEWAGDVWASDPAAAKRPYSDEPMRWHGGLHMPKWASRLRLKVVRSWPERLWEISEALAIAEGVCIRHDFQGDHSSYLGSDGPVDCFAETWDDIHGRGAWRKANPWVWRIKYGVMFVRATYKEPALAGVKVLGG